MAKEREEESTKTTDSETAQGSKRSRHDGAGLKAEHGHYGCGKWPQANLSATRSIEDSASSDRQ